jgi:hypothetical protein
MQLKERCNTMTTLDSSKDPATIDSRPHMVASRTLGEACDAGDLALVKSVLVQCQNDETIDAQVQPRLGFFMSCAASNGHADIVGYLLDNGAEFRSSPMFATQQEDTDKTIHVFDVLFDHGLDLKAYPDLIQYDA